MNDAERPASYRRPMVEADKEEIMNTKPARMLFTAVALSALAAVLASSAQARIAVGNGTKPPSQTVVHEDALAELLANSAYERIPVGNGTKPPPGAVVRAQQLLQQTNVREKLGEIGAWAVPSTSQHKPHLLRHTNKLGEIGAWATLPATKSAIIARG